jgi:hypothetical protein
MTILCLSSSFESRWRQRIRSPRTSSRARTRSRIASSSTVGTRTGTSASIINNRSTRSASRASVLTFVLRRALDLPRRRHRAPDPSLVQSPREPVPGRRRLIAHPRRARQTGQEPDHRPGVRRPSLPTDLARRRVHRHRQHATRVHIQTSPTANLRHGSALLPYEVVGDPSRGQPRRVTLTAPSNGRECRPGSTPGRPFLYTV